MAILTYGGESYTVDHAVKGADFIHGYDAEGIMIVSFEGITDFSSFNYDGTYMEPGHCLAEGCNNVKFVDGGLKKADGTTLSPADYGAQPLGDYAEASHNHSAANITSGTLAAARGGTGQTTLTPAVTTKGVRSIYAGTADMTAGSSSLTTGMLYFVYE